jgi:hypothetical protein
VSAADQACHDLLVRLAGRLPDDLLWRMRDWLADSGRSALSATLPRELLRHRVGLTDDERDMLGAAVGEWGASRRLLDAVLPAHAPDDLLVAFEAPDGPDQAALSVAHRRSRQAACRHRVRRRTAVGSHRNPSARAAGTGRPHTVCGGAPAARGATGIPPGRHHWVGVALALPVRARGGVTDRRVTGGD